MAHILRGEEHGVVIKLLEILAGELLQGPAILGKGFQALIVAARVRRPVATAMSRANLEPGEKIQNSVLNQVGEGEGRLQGRAYDAVEIAITVQPAFV